MGKTYETNWKEIKGDQLRAMWLQLWSEILTFLYGMINVNIGFPFLHHYTIQKEKKDDSKIKYDL